MIHFICHSPNHKNFRFGSDTNFILVKFNDSGVLRISCLQILGVLNSKLTIATNYILLKNIVLILKSYL